jgi:uncharacterized membrane protein
MLPKFNPNQSIAFVIAFLLIMAMLSLATLSIPPMKSPDEGAHHVRAYGITEGIFLLKSGSHQNSSLHVDVNLIEFVDGFIGNKWITDRDLKTKLKQLRWTGQLRFYDSASTGYKNPLLYLPQAAGIWLGKQLQLTIYDTYYVARSFSLAASLMLIFFSLVIFFPNPLVIGLLILPMSMFQMMMPTADGITNGLALLILCLFSRLHSAQIHSVPSSLLLAIAICFLVSSRIYTFPILLLLLFLPSVYKPPLKIALFAISAVACIGWLTFSLSNSTDLRMSRPLSSMQIAMHYLSHPIEWITIFINTISSPAQLEFYGKSFIGILGWLHIHLPQWYYYLSPVVLILLIATVFLKNAKSRQYLILDKNTLVYLGIALLMCLLVFNGMLVGWTPFPSPLIEGVQGRYLWIPACCLAFCLNAKHAYSKLNIGILILSLVLNVYIIVDSYTLFYP